MSLQSFVEQRLILERFAGKAVPLISKEEQCVAENWPIRQILIISIRPARLHRCLERLGLLCQFATIVPACHGERISRKEWGTTSSRLGRGQLGCFESHCRVWRYMVENELQQALILEDDACLYPTAVVCQHLLWVWQDVKQLQWDIICLGRSVVKRLNAERVTPRLVVSGDFYGLFGYVLTSAAALRLLQEPLFEKPIDEVVSQLGTAGALRILACEPEVFTVLHNSPSDTISIL